MSDLYTERYSEEEILNLAELDSDSVISNLIEDIKCLKEDIVQLKKQSQWISVDDFERHLVDSDFCFVYFPCGAIKKCHLNDYRTYSGKGVYWQDRSGDDLPMLNTKFIKIEIPTPPPEEGSRND